MSRRMGAAADWTSPSTGLESVGEVRSQRPRKATQVRQACQMSGQTREQHSLSNTRGGAQDMESTTAVAAPAALRETATRDLSEEIPFKDALMVALAAGLGYGFDAYAVNIYGLVLPTITASLAIGSRTAGVIGSIFLIGYTLGTIGFGVAADRYGRR